MWQLLIPAASALMSANQASNKQAQQERYNKAQAETTRYSPWTGMKGQLDTSYSPSALEGGLAGGLQGLGMWQSLKNMGFGSGSANSNPTMYSGVDQNTMQQQTNPWEMLTGKKYSMQS